eukprot:COSAG01_NODE_5038_length_4532_cov_1.902323_5_plen_282_part_00
MASLMLPLKNRVDLLYEALGDNSGFTQKTQYLNLGYWKEQPKSLDEAGQALAQLLADTGKLSQEHVLLDVGFGFAEQSLFWHKTYQPKKILGLNICKAQVHAAQQRVQEAGLSHQINLVAGSATQMPFEDQSLDRVFALECAMHFESRQDFFKEAFRVLKPGGQLVLADICGLTQPLSWQKKLIYNLACAFWQLPKSNLYPKATYKAKLEQAGFEVMTLASIEEHVYAPCFAFILKQLSNPEYRKTLTPFYRFGASLGLNFVKRYQASPFDYVLVRASKGA